MLVLGSRDQVLGFLFLRRSWRIVAGGTVHPLGMFDVGTLSGGGRLRSRGAVAHFDLTREGEAAREREPLNLSGGGEATRSRSRGANAGGLGRVTRMVVVCSEQLSYQPRLAWGSRYAQQHAAPELGVVFLLGARTCTDWPEEVRGAVRAAAAAENWAIPDRPVGQSTTGWDELKAVVGFPGKG